jgi:C4-dicarboxylate-specific signal transduction histidine kinase
VSEPPHVGGLGLRAQIALALLGVLALAATLALLAIQPLTEANARMVRRRYSVALAHALAGQVELLPPASDPAPRLAAVVGPATLAGAAMIAADGTVRARIGTLRRSLPSPPFRDAAEGSGDVLAVTVPLAAGGALRVEASLAPGASERAVAGAVLLYTAVASAAALWVVFFLLTRYIVRPVEGLTRAAERVAAGRRDALAEVRGGREIARAAHAFNAMTVELASRERELSKRVEELERATRELAAAQDQLVRSERLAVVGRLAAGIAHEVGNPLAAIVGLTDVLKDGGLSDDESRDFADRIGREAQRIHRTVRELLDYARAAPGEAEAGEESRAGSVSEAAEHVRRLLAPQKALRDVAVVWTVAPALPTVRLPTDKLVQVLLNLALNAADAVHAGGASAPRLEVRADRVGERVVIEVEDNGPGVPEPLRHRIFEPFFSTKAAGQGTGLGLAICAVIVEQAGGTLRARDRHDGAPGALLRVELPLAT